MTVFILGLIAVILVFGYWRLPLIAWTLAIAALIWHLSALAALLFLAIAAPFNVPMLRRRLVSDRIHAVYRRVLPDM
jgi:hypothetical protein